MIVGLLDKPREGNLGVVVVGLASCENSAPGTASWAKEVSLLKVACIMLV